MCKLLYLLLILAYAFHTQAQQENCNLKPPQLTIHFGSGPVSENNSMVPASYRRVGHHCPSDGHYSFTSSTNDCFRGDWFTLPEDHTPGDVNGNMLLVNSSYRTGIFLNAPVNGLKANTRYEFGVWMMNVCRITEKCPYPLLPSITIALATAEGKNVAQLEAGEVVRKESPQWTQYRFVFTTPATQKDLRLLLINNAPGGCGNDFVIDDITFRECIIVPPPVAARKATVSPKKPATVSAIKGDAQKTVTPAQKSLSKQPEKPAAVKAVTKAPVKSSTGVAQKPPAGSIKKPAVKTPSKKAIVRNEPVQLSRGKIDSASPSSPRVSSAPVAFPPPPPALTRRTYTLVKTIQTAPGQITISLYDNGEIDGDTVSIFHNNRLVAAKARLSEKPVMLKLNVDAAHPHHELVMVAENLGSIPPNTSLMVVSAGDVRHEVFISSTKQKNAKVVVDLER